MLLETVIVVADVPAVVEASFVDAAEGSRGSKGEVEDEEGKASSRTKGAGVGDSDTCSKDELQQTQEHGVAAAAAGAVELYLVAVVAVVVVAAVEAVVKYRKVHVVARLAELLSFSVVPFEVDTDPKFCSPPQVCSLYSRMMGY
jgi:hypothetical protein